jgi:hypothetical protein
VRGAVTLQEPHSASERCRPSRLCSLSASLRACKFPPTRDGFQSPWQVRRYGARLRRAADASLRSSGTPQKEQQTSERRAEGLRTVPRIARRVIAIAGCCDGWSTLRPGVSLGGPVENYGDRFDEAIRLPPAFSPGFSLLRGTYEQSSLLSHETKSGVHRNSHFLPQKVPSRQSETLMLRT